MRGRLFILTAILLLSGCVTSSSPEPVRYPRTPGELVAHPIAVSGILLNRNELQNERRSIAQRLERRGQVRRVQFTEEPLVPFDAYVEAPTAVVLEGSDADVEAALEDLRHSPYAVMLSEVTREEMPGTNRYYFRFSLFAKRTDQG